LVDRAAYVRLVVDEMLPLSRPRVAAFCDVFCDEGAFRLDEAEEILTAAAVGPGLKIHAEEFQPLGGRRSRLAWVRRAPTI
jgi:imidazolonepropionase